MVLDLLELTHMAPNRLCNSSKLRNLVLNYGNGNKYKVHLVVEGCMLMTTILILRVVFMLVTTMGWHLHKTVVKKEDHRMKSTRNNPSSQGKINMHAICQSHKPLMYRLQ